MAGRVYEPRDIPLLYRQDQLLRFAVRGSVAIVAGRVAQFDKAADGSDVSIVIWTGKIPASKWVETGYGDRLMAKRVQRGKVPRDDLILWARRMSG